MNWFNRHVHMWKPTAVNYTSFHQWWDTKFEYPPTRFQTKVLRVCTECGENDILYLDGQWTLDEVVA